MTPLQVYGTVKKPEDIRLGVAGCCWVVRSANVLLLLVCPAVKDQNFAVIFLLTDSASKELAVKAIHCPFDVLLNLVFGQWLFCESNHDVTLK